MRHIPIFINFEAFFYMFDYNSLKKKNQKTKQKELQSPTN